MRVMVIVKASKESEAGVLPKTELLAAMGKFNEELVKAGVMLAGEACMRVRRESASNFREESRRSPTGLSPRPKN